MLKRPDVLSPDFEGWLEPPGDAPFEAGIDVRLPVEAQPDIAIQPGGMREAKPDVDVARDDYHMERGLVSDTPPPVRPQPRPRPGRKAARQQAHGDIRRVVQTAEQQKREKEAAERIARQEHGVGLEAARRQKAAAQLARDVARMKVKFERQLDREAEARAQRERDIEMAKRVIGAIGTATRRTAGLFRRRQS